MFAIKPIVLEYKNTTVYKYITYVSCVGIMLHGTMDSWTISWFGDFRLLAFKVMSFLAAWIKMGDYYWYGVQGARNTTAASEMYANAALDGDPHVGRLHGSSMVTTRYAKFILFKSIILTRKSCHLSVIIFILKSV